LIKNILITSFSRRALIIATLFFFALTGWSFAKWSFANMVSTRAEATDVAEFAASLGPDDTQTHYAVAVIYDRTLLPDDQQRSLREYETAVALSPHNYLLWLEYGKALGRIGETERSQAALRRAQELAPNYSSVQWALGNLLIRTNKIDEGFSLIRKAVEGDQTYAASAASFVYQYFDGDLASVRNFVGTSREANAALVLLLAREKRFDEAAAVWQSIGRSNDEPNLEAVGRSLAGQFIAAKRFALAMQIGAELRPDAQLKAETLNNGSFEQDIKVEGADVWEWQISPGTQPQPLQSTTGPRSGAKSLVLRFASNDGASLRQLSQTVVVRSHASYNLTGFYRSDIKTSSHPAWQIVNATDNTVLAEAELTNDAAQWTSFTAKFSVPANSEGVIVRFMVKGCGSAICPINGIVSLDDLVFAPI
jgi:tetratricopeptide (TPR) repeat protein